MASWTILFFCVTLASGLDQEFIDDFMEKVQEHGTVCAEETHATSEDIAELIARQLPPSTHEGKCMLFCMQKSFNLMKEDGSLDKAGSMMTLKPLQKADPKLYQKFLKIFVTCGMRAKLLPDPCETATVLATCGKTEAEAAGLDEMLI